MKIYLLLFSFFSCNCFGQSYFYNNRYYDNSLLLEAGVSVGGMNCLTDLGKKNIDWKCTRACYGISLGFLYQYAIGARVEATFGKVNGADSLLKGNAIQRYQRNLHFRSKITEVSLLAEFHPIPRRISPYILAGVGLFTFNPEARLGEKWIALQPLRTEGRLYSKTQFNFPVGAGIKYEIDALVNARLEFLYRILQTDYLDDVSTSYVDPARFYSYFDAATASLAARLADRRLANVTRSTKRGNPLKRDTYFSLNLKISVILNRKRV